MLEVTTNDGTFITDATEKTLLKWMKVYSKMKVEGEGMPLHKVKFHWKRVNFIPAQSKKFTDRTINKTISKKEEV